MPNPEDFANSPEGQQLLAMAAASGGTDAIPSDLRQYLAATGQDQEPRWRRVLNGETPIGARFYGWQGMATPVRTTGRTEERPVFADLPEGVYGPPGIVGTEQVPQSITRTPGVTVTHRDRTGEEMTYTTGTPRGNPREPLLDVRAPLYFDGDADVEYQKMSPEQRSWAKQTMRDAGLIAPDGGGIGTMWDNTAFSAFNEVLRFSNARGTSWRVSLSYMRDYLSEHPEEKAADEGATLPAFVANVSNPEDLKKVYEQVSVRTLGYYDPTQADEFVRNFQQQQTASQRAQYDATYVAGKTGVGPGGTVVEAPSPDVAAEQALRASNPAAAGGTDILGQYANLMDIIGGMGSG